MEAPMLNHTVSSRSTILRGSLSKPVLFGTTALVGGGLVLAGSEPARAQEDEEEQQIRLELTGFLNNFYGVTFVDTNSDEQDFNNFTTHFDGEVQFRGTTTLQDGTEVGVQFEIEIPSQNDVRATLDENYLWIEGGLGQLRLGGDNTAMYIMGLGTFDAGGIGVPINSGWISDFIPAPPGFTAAFRSPALSTAIDIVSDDNVMTYFSPRLAGFQFGASYVPRASFAGKPVNGPVNRNAQFDSADDRYENGVSVGGNWVGELDPFSLGFSAGYAQAQAIDSVEEIGGDDIQQVMVGGTIGFAGLSLDASYANEIDGRFSGTAADPVSTQGESWIVGLSYEVGPWTTSVSYMRTHVEGNINESNDDKLQAGALSLGWAWGPGITIAGTLLYADWDEQQGGSQDGVALASGL